jgi:hypothetical protein
LQAESRDPSARRLALALRRTAARTPSGEAEACILVPAADAGAAPGSLTLNRVGAWIWERLDGRTTGRDLVEALMAEFDVERARAEGDYLALADRLLELGAVAPVETSD